MFVLMFACATGCLAETGWQADPEAVATWTKRRIGNFDEAKVPAYQLPQALVTISGQRVENAEAWRGTRRPELLTLFRDHVYGNRPGTAYKIAYTEVDRKEDVFGLGATASEVVAKTRVGEHGHAFKFVLVVPASKRPAPLIVLINNRYRVPIGQAVEKDDPFWPVEMLVRRGYATACFHTSDVDPDDPKRYAAGVRALLEDPESPKETRWGALSAWGWGASRVLDYAGQQPGVDAARSALVGHSRGGKAALWAAAEDQRFAIAYSNNSGCGGAALSRRVYGESVQRITTRFPHWFAPAFSKYGGAEGDLPVDQHQLVSLIAPRGVYIASADADLWADPRGEYLSLVGAESVYRLLGEEALSRREMPPLDSPAVCGQTGYHIRSGKHNLTREDWASFLDFADRVLKD